MKNLRKIEGLSNISPNANTNVVGSPSCDSENEYSQGFKQNIQPVDNGEWRQSASIFATDADTQ